MQTQEKTLIETLDEIIKRLEKLEAAAKTELPQKGNESR